MLIGTYIAGDNEQVSSLRLLLTHIIFKFHAYLEVSSI